MYVWFMKDVCCGRSQWRKRWKDVDGGNKRKDATCIYDIYEVPARIEVPAGPKLFGRCFPTAAPNVHSRRAITTVTCAIQMQNAALQNRNRPKSYS